MNLLTNSIYKYFGVLVICLCCFLFINIAKFFWYPAFALAYPLHAAIRGDIKIISHTLPYLFIFNNQKTRNLKSDCGHTPLQAAANENDFEVVDILLSLGASPEGCNSHVLMSASSLDMMQHLLDNGISPNSRIGYRRIPVIYSFAGCFGMNKLAANPKLELLLNNGADPNALLQIKTTYDPSALYKAAEHDCIGNVKLLLSKGADPLHVTYKKRGRTTLDHIKDKDIYPWNSSRYTFSDELIQTLEAAEIQARIHTDL